MLSGLYNFIVIENFSALVTFVVGLSAFFIYSLQKSDHKTNTAKLIISEIRAAEEKVQEVINLTQDKNKDWPTVLATNNWKENSYLFASDLDQDELSEINSFYSVCESIDEYTTRDNEYFWITTQHRAGLVQDMLSKTIEKYYDPKKNTVDELKVKNELEKIIFKYADHHYQYLPGKTMFEIKRYVAQYNKISTTTTVLKLKKIANKKPWYKAFISTSE